jgi:hypothetical protein
MNRRFPVNNVHAEAEARHPPHFSGLAGKWGSDARKRQQIVMSRIVRLRPIDNVSDAVPDRFFLPEGEQGSSTTRGTDNEYQP